MPPVLFFILQAPMTTLAHALFTPSIANGIISGCFTFYVLYDCMHYAFVFQFSPLAMRSCADLFSFL
jgi:4-hydroxysphinganine ceramide fatty acyl 2-hydroxylase